MQGKAPVTIELARIQRDASYFCVPLSKAEPFRTSGADILERVAQGAMRLEDYVIFKAFTVRTVTDMMRALQQPMAEVIPFPRQRKEG